MAAVSVEFPFGSEAVLLLPGVSVQPASSIGSSTKSRIRIRSRCGEATGQRFHFAAASFAEEDLGFASNIFLSQKYLYFTIIPEQQEK